MIWVQGSGEPLALLLMMASKLSSKNNKNKFVLYLWTFFSTNVTCQSPQNGVPEKGSYFVGGAYNKSSWNPNVPDVRWNRKVR